MLLEMEKQSIKVKLGNFLNKHPVFAEECEAVYFLVEIRKLIEGNKKYGTLYFYCCWIAHSQLSRKSTAQFLSDKFDNLINFQKKKKEIQHDLINGQKDFFKLKDLNNELRAFLNAKKLPANFLDGDAWYKFCQLFLDNITECGIDIGTIKKQPHKINKLIVEKINKQYFYGFYLANNVRIPRIILKYKNK
jgi:hypothetical protein